MARIYQDGFESGHPLPHGSTAPGDYRGSLWQHYMTSSSSSASIGVSARARGGLYALRINLTSSRDHVYIRRDLGSSMEEHYGRIDVMVEHLEPDQSRQDFMALMGADAEVLLRMRFKYENQGIQICEGKDGDMIEEIPNAWAGGEWFRLEWHLIVGESGQLEVRIDGNNQLIYSGDTRGDSSENFRYLCLGDVEGGTRSDDYRCYIDNVAINDTEGTINNSWCGGGHILALPAVANGHYSGQFISNIEGREAWEQVGFIPHRGDERYIESDEVGDKASFEIPGISTALMQYNVALEAESYLASTDSDTAPQGFNGNPDNAWEGSDDEWVAVDFGEGNDRTVTNIAIYNSDGRRAIKEFRFEGSNDAETWDTLFEGGLDHPEVGTYYRVTIPDPAPYRYYRVYIVERWDSVYVPYLYDCKMFEEEELDEDAVLKSVSILSAARWEGYNAGMKLLARIETDEHWSDYLDVPSDYRFIQLMLNRNPFTEDEWSEDAIDNLEVGISHEEFEEL